MRAALESLLDFIEKPASAAKPWETLLFTIFALGAMVLCCGAVLALVYVGGWYALAVMGGAVVLGCVYVAGVSHGRQT